MKTTCLITNHNYEQYVFEAIESALNQTVEFDEILVIDGGSTDRSVELLKKNYDQNSKVKLILNADEGQLSNVYKGMLVSTGELIFLLDADDIYKENYLELALEIYKKNKCDFLFCAHEDFTETKTVERLYYNKTIDLGYSLILATWTNKFRYFGSVTSTISAKKGLLEQLFPYPFMRDWRADADFFITYASSMAGARKAYCSEILVSRRIHSSNLSQQGLTSYKKRERLGSSRFYADLLKQKRFKNLMKNLFGIDKSILHNIVNEFQSIPTPTYNTLIAYIRVVSKSDYSILKKLKRISSMYRYYFASQSSTSSKVKYVADSYYKYEKK